MEQKRKEGLYVAAFTPYGYQKSEENKNQLVIDEQTAPIIKDIFKMKLDGMSAAKIADVLNEKGILSLLCIKKKKDTLMQKADMLQRKMQNGRQKRC